MPSSQSLNHPHQSQWRPNMGKILIEAGADIKALETISNCTPAELAHKQGNNK